MVRANQGDQSIGRLLKMRVFTKPHSPRQVTICVSSDFEEYLSCLKLLLRSYE